MKIKFGLVPVDNAAELAQKLEPLAAACAAVGRDPVAGISKFAEDVIGKL